MLHRLALRVLPGLTLAVTEETVRKRKRFVMLAPGLVAYGLYRAIKQVNSLADPAALLCVCGILSTVTALAAYRVGRQIGFAQILRQDGVRRMGWVIGWIGFVYGVQLALLVLALLKFLVGYDFLRHPDGPAMMAIIIACTSVARDAFEIGHVRWLQSLGRPVLTFPDGEGLRKLSWQEPTTVVRWVFVGGGLCACMAAILALMGAFGRDVITQFVGTALAGGTIALWAYLVGFHHSGSLIPRLEAFRWKDLFRFWWWPGLAFSATYYLVLVGALAFVLRLHLTPLVSIVVSAGVGALMAVYAYYLGERRYREDGVHQEIPASLLRCPFVMGILTKNVAGKHPAPLASAGVALNEVGRQG